MEGRSDRPERGRWEPRAKRRLANKNDPVKTPQNGSYASRSSSLLVRIWVYRDIDGNPSTFMVNSLDPTTPSSWSPVPSYAVSYADPTPAARRMATYIDGWGESWFVPSPTGALFSSQQPGWRSTPL